MISRNNTYPRAKRKTLILSLVWVCCAFAPASAAENDAPDNAIAADDGTCALSIPSPLPDRWIAPPPDERPLMGILEGTVADGHDQERAKTVRDVSMSVGIAGLCAGTVLAASGVYRIYSAARQGPDMGGIHDGIGIIISGSFVTALSSMLFSAARDPHEPRMRQ